MGVINKAGALYFASGIDNTGMYRDADETKRIVGSITEQVRRAGMVIGAVFGAQTLAQFGREIINVRGEMQMLEKSFEVLLGGSSGVAAFMKELKQFAVESPLSMTGVANATQMLSAYGIESEKLIPIVRQLGDISMGNEEKFRSLALAYAQMTSAGQVLSQDMRQMATAGFNPLNEIARTTGKTMQEVTEEMGKGKITVDMVANAFKSATSEGGKFYGMTQKQADGIKGLKAQIEGATQEAFNNLGKQSEKVIEGTYKATISLIENYETIGRAIAGLITTYGAYRAAVVAVTVAESGWTIASMAQYKWLVMVEKAQKLLNMTMLKNPFVAVTVAIVGLISVIATFSDRTTIAEKAQKKLNDTLEEAKNRKEALKTKGNELISVLNSETASVYQQTKAYKELIALLPGLKGKSIDDIKKMDPADIGKMLSEKSDKAENDAIQAQYDERIKNIEGYRTQIKKLTSEGADSATISYYREQLGVAINETKLLKAQLDEIAAIQKEAFYQENPEAKRRDLQSERVALLRKEAELQERIKAAGDNDLASANDRIQLNAVQSAIKGVNDQLNSLNKTSHVVKNHAYWEKIKDDAEKARKALGSDKQGSDEWNELTRKINQANVELKKYSDKEVGATQANQTGDANRKLLDLRKKNAIEEKRLIEDIENDVQQAEINARSDGFTKTMKQRGLNHQIEIQNLKRQKEDYINRIIQARKEEFDAQEDVKSKENKNYVKKTFDESTVSVDASAYDKVIAGKNEQYKNETKKSWNDLALEFGDYYQKRIAIAEKWEKEIAELPSQFQAGARIKMNAELAGLDDEYKKTTNAITELFKDTSEKTSEELRKITDEAERMKDFVIGGQWNASEGADFGITEAQFKSLNEEWGKSPEKLEAIIKAIRELKREAYLKENTFKAISNSIEAILDPKTGGKDKKKAWSDLANGIGEVNDMAQSVGNNISSIFSAFGNDKAAEMAGNITDLIGGVGQSGMGIAQLASGDIIGGIKSLASGITNVVTSITRMNDAVKEKKIQQLQAQIDALEKSYDTLGNAIDKAYSKDASKLIEHQNGMLKQQQLLIKQQIREEEAKKKTDKSKIAEWNNVLSEIDKQISENKVKAVDAIFGEDVQSAIDNFAQAYANMWAAGDDKAKSRKEFVKNMIKGMILEAMKADVAKPMEAIREKLKAFWSDDKITGAEADIIDNMVADLQSQLDKKYSSWADKYIKDRKSGVTGELQAQMTEGTGSQLVGLWNMTAMDTRAAAMDTRDIKEHLKNNPMPDVAKDLYNIQNELAAINRNTRETADNTSHIEEGFNGLKEELSEIKKNTKQNNSRG